MDHINRGHINFSEMETIVLDEADVMLDLGFKEDIDKIIRNVKSVCNGRTIQICLFSATQPKWIFEVARAHMRCDVSVVDLA